MRVAIASATIILALLGCPSEGHGEPAKVAAGLVFLDCTYQIPCQVVGHVLTADLRHQVVMECSAEGLDGESPELIVFATAIVGGSAVRSIDVGKASYWPLAMAAETIRVDVSELLEWAAGSGADPTGIALILAEAGLLEQDGAGCSEDAYPVRLGENAAFVISERE